MAFSAAEYAAELPYTLYDRFIACEMTYLDDKGKQKTIFIDCPVSGMKPSIRLVYKRVEGNFVYNATLSFTNLYIRVNPANIEEIRLQMGYRGGTKGKHFIELHLVVFDAYQDTPGPDGVLTCECIVGKSDTGIWGNQGYRFWLYNNPDRYRVDTVLAELQSQTGIQVDNYLGARINDMRFSKKDIEPQIFYSFYSLAHWIQSILNKLAAPNKVTTILFDDRIIFLKLNEQGVADIDAEKSLVSTGQKVPHLVLVEEAEWNAAVLTVKAPFVPEIVPGKLFLISPKYYKASHGLPNEVARQKLQQDSLDAYFVLTQQVNFASTGTENSMTITAIPYKWSPLANQQDTKTDISFEAYKQQYDNEAQKLSEQSIKSVGMGEKGKLAEETEEIKEVKDIKDISLNLNAAERTDYIIGSNLGYKPEGVAPDNQPDASGIGPICNRTYFALPDLKYKLKNRDAPELSIDNSVAWLPFVLASTYTYYRQLQSQGNPKASDYKIDPTKPNLINIDRHLLLPSSNLTWQDVQTKYGREFISVCKTCAAYYVRFEDKKAYAAQLEKIANVLEKKEVWEIL